MCNRIQCAVCCCVASGQTEDDNEMEQLGCCTRGDQGQSGIRTECYVTHPLVWAAMMTTTTATTAMVICLTLTTGILGDNNFRKKWARLAKITNGTLLHTSSSSATSSSFSSCCSSPSTSSVSWSVMKINQHILLSVYKDTAITPEHFQLKGVNFFSYHQISCLLLLQLLLQKQLLLK